MFRHFFFALLVAALSAQTTTPYPPLMTPAGVDDVSMDPEYVPFPAAPATTTTGSLSVNSSGLTATIKQTLTFSANQPAQWALMPGSMGTLKVIDSMHASYTAPASIPSQNHYGGCPVSPNDALWNVPVDKFPVHPLSASWTIAPNTTTNALRAEASWGVGFADALTPTYPMVYYYTTANNNLVVPVPLAPRARQHGSLDASNNDHHAITLRATDCTWYETYNDSPDHLPYLCRDGKIACTAQSGIAYGWVSQKNWGKTGGATDAAGMPLKPLTLSSEDVRRGLNHALRFTLPQAYIQKGGALWPSFSGNGWGGALTAPYGARLRLKPGYNVGAFSPLAQNILRGMQQYGLFLADAYPGGFAFTVSYDVATDRGAMNAVGEVSNKLHMSDFEYVDESSLMTATNTYLANWNQPYQQPLGGASLVVTDAATPTSVIRLPIELQPVLIGVREPHMNVVAGTSNPFPVPYWVTGTSNKLVSITSALGTISDTLIYTPPPSVTVPTADTITIRSVADPNASATINLTVFPASADGSFRVDFGSSSNTKDAKGQAWWNDSGVHTGIYIELAGDYPSWAGIPASGTSARAQIQSTGYTYGDDLRYVLYGLRDGYYYLHLWFGLPYQGCAVSGDITKCANANPDWHSHIDILATGLDGELHTVQADYNFEAATNYKHGVATDLMIPANVVNGRLEIALVADNPRHGTTIAPAPLWNAMEILPAPFTPLLPK